MTHAPHSPVFRPASAFTLLEMLVALSILAVLVSSLYAVFYNALNLREKRQDALDTQLPLDYVTLLIKRDLRGMLPPTGTLSGTTYGEKVGQEATRNDTLEFYSTSGLVNDTAPWGNVQKIEYYLKEPEKGDVREKGYDLIRGITRNLLATVETDHDEQCLLHAVRALKFQYYQDDEWLDSWDSTTNDDANPEAVCMYVEFAESGSNKQSPASLELVCELTTQSAQEEESESDSSQNSSGGQTESTAGGTAQGGMQ